VCAEASAVLRAAAADFENRRLNNRITYEIGDKGKNNVPELVSFCDAV
jgi:hypothetical protein